MSARAASTQYYPDNSQSHSVYQQTHGSRTDQTGKIANFFWSCRLYWTSVASAATPKDFPQGELYKLSRLRIPKIRLNELQSACRLLLPQRLNCQIRHVHSDRETESQRGNVAHSRRRASDSLPINAALTGTGCRKPVTLSPIRGIGISASTGTSSTAVRQTLLRNGPSQQTERFQRLRPVRFCSRA